MNSKVMAPERLPSPGRFKALVSHGFSVFPIRHPDLDQQPHGKRGKRPAVEWGPYRSAPPTKDEVQAWESDGRHLNVAVVTGGPSGVVVLDIDGVDAMRELEVRGYALPSTPRVKTGRGYHVYLAHPGHEMRNRVALGGIPGLDFRGDGGYVVGPGSIHESGARYEWETGPADVPFAPIPEWLIKLHDAVRALGDSETNNHDVHVDPPAGAGGDDSCAQADLAGEVQNVLNAMRPTGPEQPGNRNDTLNRAAFALGPLVVAGLLDRAEVEARLYAASVENGLVADDGERAVRATIRSGLDAGIRESRRLEIPPAVPCTTGEAGGASATSSAGAISRAPAAILVPGEHHTRIGIIEQGADDFTEQVLGVLCPGTLYRWDRIVGEIIGPPGATVFHELTADRLRICVDRDCRLARWRRLKGKRPEIMYVSCNRDLAGLVLAAAAGSSHVRELRLITHYPVFAGPDFDLVRPGWNPEHGILYDEPVDLQGIEPAPFDADALFDLMVDFPFRDQASQVNVLGLILTPLIRAAIGVVPIHLVLSSIERTGKGMLISSLLGHGMLGTTIPSVQLGEREEEREKRITALILEGATVVHLDNIPGTHVLDSPSLSALTTSPLWKGRTLGVSSMPSLPNTLTLVASANNLRASSEVAKRMVPIWLEPKTDRPEARSDFLHPDIHAYAAAKRRQTLSILLGMVLRWKDAGRPAGSQRFGGFEAWTGTVGGVLELHDLGKPWLANRQEWAEQSDEWARDARILVELWADRHGTNAVTAKDVLELVRETGTFLFVTGRPENGQPVALARSVLTPLCDRPVGRWRVRRHMDSVRKTNMYVVQAI